MMDFDDCFFYGVQKWNDDDIRSQSHKTDFQGRIPRAPSVDNLLFLDSVKTNDIQPTASQMMFDFSTPVTPTQFENSHQPKTNQTRKSQLNPISVKPIREEQFAAPRKRSINKDSSNVPSTPSYKKPFNIPFKGQSQIYPQENIALSQIQQNRSNILEKSNFSADDDLFADPKPSQFQKQDNPYLHPRENSHLKSVKEIPSKFRDIFPFEYFNPIQTKIFDDALYSDKSLVVCAPTGAGKTVIFELAIVRLLLLAEESARHDFKAVYMAPIKALCSERYQDWQMKLEDLGIHCLELTGDTELDDCSVLQTTNIIITTPEKWDSVTRRWHCDNTLIQNLQLFMIDEVHTLNDSQRGATMEAVISRMKTIHVASKWLSSNQNKVKNSIRFIAVSATIPNLLDIAEWLGEPNMPALSFHIDESQRPVKLKKIVLGYPCSDRQSGFQFDISLRYKLHSVITSYSDGKPTLVFCSTRKGVFQTADLICKHAKFINSTEMRDSLYQCANLLKDSKLRDILIRGVGCHHAGMDVQDRKYIAQIFESGNLLVLVATTTLAMGVNLPAHLVIVMSTQYYVLGNHQEYSESQVLQMIGRAGRPQFDTSATAVIMTKMNLKHKYENLLDGKQKIESSLHKNLIEHLNAEIFLNTINDISVAVEWIKHTFLYIRVRKNPTYYGISSQMTEEQLEKYLQDLCLRNLNNLASIDLIKLDEDNFDIKPLDSGKLMARYCIAFDTMKGLSKVTGTEDLQELLNLLTGSSEFKDIQLRINEKKTLNLLNKDKTKPTIRFPMKDKIKTKEMKINCLIQASLGCLQVPDFALSQDVNKIFRSGQRITRCLLEMLWLRDTYNGLVSAIYLYKCFRAKIWENSKYVTKQLDGIGQFLSNALFNSGITTFEMFERTDPREIEMITNRHPPFGNQLKSTVAGLPKYKLTVEQNPICGKPYAEIEIHLDISNIDQVKENSLTADTHTCALIIANADNQVIYKRKIMDKHLLIENGFSKLFHVKKANNGGEIYINLISFDWVGIDIVASFKPMFLKDEIDREKMINSAETNGEKWSSSSNAPACTQKPIQASDKTSCQHRCLNKKECAHPCCKDGYKNAAQKRKEISKRNSLTPRSQPPKTKVSTAQSSLYCYIDGLKDKMRNITDTPTVKRLKASNETQTVIDLKKFAFCPKPKISPQGVPPDPNAASPTIKCITPLVKKEPNGNKQMALPATPNGWNLLDIYHKTREKFAYEPDVSRKKEMEQTFNQLDNSFKQENIPPSSPKEIPVLDEFSDEELYGDFSLELPILTQQFNKTNDLLTSEHNTFCKNEDTSQRQTPISQLQHQHKYGQVVAWRSQDSPRRPFQKNNISEHDFPRPTSESLTNEFKLEQRMNDLIASPNPGLLCSTEELQHHGVQEKERSAPRDNEGGIYSIFDGIF